MPTFHKIAISKKIKSFSTFWLFFFESMNPWLYPSKYSKRFIEKRSLQILIGKAKHLVITQRKDKLVQIVLPYLLQQNVSVELHMI